MTTQELAFFLEAKPENLIPVSDICGRFQAQMQDKRWLERAFKEGRTLVWINANGHAPKRIKAGVPITR